jgi:hypothetical protein
MKASRARVAILTLGQDTGPYSLDMWIHLRWDTYNSVFSAVELGCLGSVWGTNS